MRAETLGQGHVKRLMGSGAGLIFKGSGFYITDNRSENYKSGAKKETTAGESKTAPAKTEAKAEAKVETKPKAAPAKKD